MTNDRLELIFLPTLRCNAECDYCFEDKTPDTMTLDQFAILINKLLDHMEQTAVEQTTIYWQGGEVFTMDPGWLLRAGEIIESLSRPRGRRIINRVQSNLLGYCETWNAVIREMFGNQVGSSLDYPNLYRRVVGQGPETYNQLWLDRFREATANQIEIGIISIPSEASLEMGAAAFYSYFFDEIGLTSIQLNPPFPGGPPSAAKRTFPLNPEKLSHFFIELADLWLEQGYAKGIRIRPFNVLIQYFLEGVFGDLPCPWHPNCTGLFFCIDPKGNVSQCDCWVTSYPEFWFGNIFTSGSLRQILNSEARQRIRERPLKLIENCDCVECEYLAICHGGCPIKAYSTYGDIYAKDPYCEAYKTVIKHLEKSAVRLARKRYNQFISQV